MPTISISISEGLKEKIDRRKDEKHGGNRSEAVEQLLRYGFEYEALQSRLESREERIDTLEEQLARRSQIEERVDEIALELREERDQVAPPWPVRWYRYFANK